MCVFENSAAEDNVSVKKKTTKSNNANNNTNNNNNKYHHQLNINIKIIIKSPPPLSPQQILIDHNTKRAYGVKFVRGGRTQVVLSRKEVVLSAGSVNSPQLLMLSGIGPAKQLHPLGVRIKLIPSTIPSIYIVFLARPSHSSPPLNLS